MTKNNIILPRVEKNFGLFTKWAELLVLIQQSFSYMETRIDPPSSIRRLDINSLRQKSEIETLFFMQIDEHLVGCAFAKEYQNLIYVGKVATSPNFQGRGIGQKLISACRDLAISKEKPILEIQIRVELIENQQFFKKLGFVKTGEIAHAGYLRPTSYTYQLDCR